MRLRVERNSFPPGASSAASVARNAVGIGDVLDHLQCRDDREARRLGQQVLGDAGPIGQRQALAFRMGTRRLDRPAGGIQAQHVKAQASKGLGRHPGAAPDIKQPWSGGSSEILPLPLREGVGGGQCVQPSPDRSGDWLLIRAAIHATRVGFIRCSGRIGPSGSHHRAASASNCATSAGETVTLGMVAPVVPRQYEHLESITDNWLECRES